MMEIVTGQSQWLALANVLVGCLDGPSSGVLPYGDGSGTKTFDLIVVPDDSENAGSSNSITIQAKDGNTVKVAR